MNFSKEISNWLSKFKYNFFKYKDGFFHLKIGIKSPQQMVDSFDKIPFLKHNKLKERISTNNPMMKIDLYYHEIEKGLWLMYSESEYKSNIFYTPDSNIDDDEYHFINLHTNNSKFQVKKMLVNGIPLQNNMWNIVKPKTVRQLTHFKNIKEKNLTVYFNKEFLLSKTSFFKKITSEQLEIFFGSNNLYLYAQEVEDKSYLFKKGKELFTTLNKTNKNQDLSEFAFELVENFVSCLEQQVLTENYCRLTDYDRKKIQLVEELLIENITHSFPGIEALADSAGISATKLKNDFKTVHETSIFQFFRNNQLNMAYNILRNKSLKIKHIALLFGYENTSKFSTAFKNKFGISPSDIESSNL